MFMHFADERILIDETMTNVKPSMFKAAIWNAKLMVMWLTWMMDVNV